MSAFGGGFGQQSPFGQSAFGSAPAFGAQSNSLFGQSQSSFGAFGQSSGFGASSSAFGSTSAFGAQSNPSFGSTFGSSFGANALGSTAPFGSSQPAFASTPAFGAPSSSNLFGAQSASAFGSNAPPAFGQSQSAWGQQSASGFGSTPAFGANSAPLFGNAASNSLFGAQNTSPFGSASQAQRGTAGVTWQLTIEQDGPLGAQSKYHTISMMQPFRDRNVEELRIEDYAVGNKSNQSQSQPQSTAFGAASTPAFGAAAPALGNTSGFGSTPFGSSAAGFGATNTAFGSTATGFGQPSTAFAAQSTPGFGQQPSGFGASATGFGNTAPAFGSTAGFGANNPQSANAFGQTNPFGNTAQPTSFGPGQTTAGLVGGAPSGSGFNAAPSTQPNPFGSQPQVQFGAAQPNMGFATQNPAQQGFAAQSGTGFGGFGQTTPSGGFGLGFTSQPGLQTQGMGFGLGAIQPKVGGNVQNVAGTFGVQPSISETYQAISRHHGSTVAPVGANYGTVLHNLQVIQAKVDEQKRIFGEQAKLNEKNNPKPPGAVSVVVLPSPPLVKLSSGRDPVSKTQGLVARTPFRTKMRGSVARYGEAAGFSPRVSGTPIRENGKEGDHTTQKTGQTASPAPSMALTTLFTPKQFSASKRRPPRYSEGATPARSASKMLPLPKITRQGELSPDGYDLDAEQEQNIISQRTPRNSLTPRNAKRITVGYMTETEDTPNGHAPKTNDDVPTAMPTSILRKPKRDSTSNSEGTPMDGGKKYTGRISGSEEFMWAHPRPSTWSKKQGLDSDEQYMPDKYLPFLSKDGFYTEPALQELASRDMTELQMVQDFTVGRHGVGKVRWIQPVDVRGLDLDLAVDIQHGEVAVYPERDAGQLDAAAEVTLENMFRKKGNISPDDEEMEKRYEKKLRAFCTKNGLQFVDYNPTTGHWTFEVPGFAPN